MDDYSSLTPEQMLMLKQFGMLYGGAPQYTGGGFGGQVGEATISGGANTFAKPGAQYGMGGINAVIPFNGGSINPSVQATSGSIPNQPSNSVTPSATLNYGPFSATYGQQYQDGKKLYDTYGAGISSKLGPVDFNYMKSIGANGTGVDQYGLKTKLGDTDVNAMMVRGKSAPTSYQIGFSQEGKKDKYGYTVPGLLSGDLAAAVEYKPESKSKSAYFKYKRDF